MGQSDFHDEDELCAELNDGRRMLFELSAAVRRGDREGAEYQLDLISAELGPWAREEIEQGRFSVKAG